ncbi:hypothetical protein C0995_005440 [Termitomyces sp. Mi166|nr:hypothetical protein C0995_005440 [Termitomyces sp. Mi166\
MSNFLAVPENGDRASLYSVVSVKPSPDTLTKLIKRLRALTLALLPVQVDPASLNEPTGRIITPNVISAYQAAAGDFVDALPYCLLRARAEFMWDANHNIADYGENVGRAIACEVLARRIVHMSPPENLRSIMSSRFQHRQLDGNKSDMTSALEVAIDSNWYQNIFRIIIWLFFLFAYSQADLHKFYLVVWFSTLRALSFWNIVAFITDSLFVAAFALRVIGFSSTGEYAADTKLKSFQVLSFAAPFIWLIDMSHRYVGTMQICVARMLKESGIFFALLSVLAVGFAQGLFALDAADGLTEGPSVVIEDAEAQYLAFFAAKTIGMIRAPDSFVYPAPFNLKETFFVAPFEYDSFPINDSRVQTQPEELQGAHRTYHVPQQLNRYVMGVLFFIPLTVIAFYEAVYEQQEHTWLKNWLRGIDEGAADYAEDRDPEVDDTESGGKISKVPFEELVKMFPNTEKSSEAVIMSEVHELKAQLARVLEKLEA